MQAKQTLAKASRPPLVAAWIPATKASADLLISAGSSMRMGLAFGGLAVVGAIAMVIYELFS